MQFALRTFILSILLIGFCHSLAAQTTKLKILSWNIYMLPRHIKHTGKLPRAKEIGKLLKESDYDIIVFQEAFHGGARRRIRKALADSFAYRIGPANRHYFGFKTNSGIWILSKTPITKIATINFKECEGPDCWAHKGALLVEGEKDGKKFQVLGTHLEAGGPQTIRDGQYKEINDFLLDKYAQPGVPQFVCGDFNTGCNDTICYPTMLSTLKAEDGEPYGDQKYTADGTLNDFKRGHKSRRLIDYIFYRGNGYTVKSIQRQIKIFTAPWKKDYKDLSDHFAVEAVIEF